MLYIGYMHPKSIFLLTDVVSTSVYGCLKLIFEKNIFEFENFVLFLFYMSLYSSYKPMQGVIWIIWVQRIFPSQKQWQH